jgi:hypothetical protein
MLRIGSNEYELIRVYSGFSVTLNVKGDDVMGREAHYVPGGKYTPRADGAPEYLVLNIRSEEYKVSDWRKLSGLGLDTEETTWLGWCSLSNLLVGRHEKESWTLTDGWLEVDRLQDYLFHCEYTGARKLEDGALKKWNSRMTCRSRKSWRMCPSMPPTRRRRPRRWRCGQWD